MDFPPEVEIKTPCGVLLHSHFWDGAPMTDEQWIDWNAQNDEDSSTLLKLFSV